MRTSTLVLASVLAVAVSAQTDIPESCTNAATLVQSCIPPDATEEDLTGSEVANCLCRSGSFDDDIVACIQDAGTILPEETQQALEAFSGYCALYGNGGGSSPGNTGSPTTGPSETEIETETSEPTSEPTGDSGDSGSPNCNYIVSGLQSCYTDDSVSPTAAPVARCLCSGGSFDAAVDGCIADLSDDDTRSSVALFSGFCSSFSAGEFGGSGPTPTDDSSSPTPTNGSDEGGVTSSTVRVIQTLNPQTTSGSNTNGGSTNGGNNGGSNGGSNGGNNNGGSGPNSAAGLKVTILGTAMAALLAGAALIL